jgi:pimeloyl-ACP methyl ester carboxylesterase
MPAAADAPAGEAAVQLLGDRVGSGIFADGGWPGDRDHLEWCVPQERAAVMGANEGSLMAALFAATYPERVSALVLANATARPAWAPDHPWGRPPDAVEALVGLIEQTWGKGDVMAALNPSIANDQNALEAWGRFMRLSASPAVAAAVTKMAFELDIREILPAISAPTLVVQRRGNPLIPPESGRDVARRIPGAKFVEVPGDDYGFAVGDVDIVIDEVEEFLTGARHRAAGDRVLSTILFTDIVDSTTRAVKWATSAGASCSRRTRHSPGARSPNSPA